MVTTPRLSLCMIVKNEEEWIARCLASVCDAVDEIVIVDTGSTDRTVDICRSFGARVESYEWNGSFADARNYGIGKAKGEWILWLDADEEADQEDLANLRNAPELQQYDVLTIHLINYYGERVDKLHSTDIAHTRLFRSDTGVRFINKIHECLDIAGLNENRVGHLPVRIHHYGYLDSVVEKKGKYKRNLDMLEEQIKDNENVYWAQYYIASEYYRNRQFQEAFERVNRSIAAFLKENVLPPSMVYKLKYSIYIATGSFQEAWPGIERAVSLYPDYVDLRFFMGMILYHLEKYDSALQAFEQCLEMGEDNLNHLVLRGVGSFQAWHYKGLCLQKLDRSQEAVFSFLHALQLYPRYSFSLESLNTLQKELESLDPAAIAGHFTEEEYKDLQKQLDFQSRA